ncbi:uncharacterized protein CC84DRAFT_1068720, partial [Paraphaeosphaeria sporulosa]
RESLTSLLSASDWRKIDRLLRAVVDIGGDHEAKKLSRTVHHISVKKQRLEHINKGLREALVIQKRHSTRGRPLPLDRSDEYHGGAVFWSPHSIQRARDRQHQKETDEEQLRRQKADQAEARRASQQLKARLLQERR